MAYLADCLIWHCADCVRQSWIKYCSQLVRLTIVAGNAAHASVWEPPASDLGKRHSNHRVVIGGLLEVDIGEAILPRQLDLVGLGHELSSLDHAVHGRNSTNMWIERVWQSI